MQAGTGGVELAAAHVAGLFGVREGLVLADEVDDIETEAVCAAAEPEAHDVMDGLANLWVLPVQVGLLFAEQVQVVLVGSLIVLPSAACEVILQVRRCEMMRDAKKLSRPEGGNEFEMGQTNKYVKH